MLALGLKKETADMYYTNASFSFEKDKFHLECKDYSLLQKEVIFQICPFTFIPAWSLHRLIEMMPQEISYEDSTLILGVFGDGVYYADNEYGEVFKDFDGHLYDCVVKCIEWLIKEGHFNKEYLEEGVI